MSSEALSGPKALGAFLRAHRERITPEMLGLPSSSRRRTSGLRREELAQISGISATWYTWIEQGREVSISPSRWRASPRRCGSAPPNATTCLPWRASPTPIRKRTAKPPMTRCCKACTR